MVPAFLPQPTEWTHGLSQKMHFNTFTPISHLVDLISKKEMNQPMTQGYYFANVKCYFFISPPKKKNPINILTTPQNGWFPEIISAR